MDSRNSMLAVSVVESVILTKLEGTQRVTGYPQTIRNQDANRVRTSSSPKPSINRLRCFNSCDGDTRTRAKDAVMKLGKVSIHIANLMRHSGN